jgi:glycosyltransferase involved in cell wall biosynthesis
MKAGKKKVLVLAYYFPPLGMGGVQRVTKFVKYLPLFGWKPYVLTVKDADYWAKDYSLLEELPSEAKIIRTGSLDPLRISFVFRSIFGKGQREGEPVRLKSVGKSKLSSWLFFPDSKIGWIPFALTKALLLCRKEKFDLIFSSSPPPSVHLTGCLLNLITGIPWIADFRDAWTGYKLETFPTPLHLFLKEKAQRLFVGMADRVIVANPAIGSDFEIRYPQTRKIRLVSQGYDEEDFKTIQSTLPETFTIGYLGTLSPDCDPEPFLSALSLWVNQGMIPKEKVRFLHVGLSRGIDLDRLIRKYRLEGVAEKRGYLSHRESLNEMKGVSLLLLVTSDHPSIFPAKVFEYLRLKKPVLGIVPPGSQIGRLLTEMRIGRVVSPEDKRGIKEALQSCFSESLKGGSGMHVDEGNLRKYERKSLSLSLASHFNQVACGRC